VNKFITLTNEVSPPWLDLKTLPSGSNIICEENLSTESKFHQMFMSEVQRISIFFTKQLNDVETQLENFMQKANADGIVRSNEINEGLQKRIRKMKKDRELSVLRAYTALYKTCERLEAFAFLNVILCIKILKKYDKYHSQDGLSLPLYPNLMESLVYQSSFGSTIKPQNRLEYIQQRLIELCAEFSCDGDLVEAKGKLKMTKGEEREEDTWTLGIRCGIVLVLFLWFLWDAVVDPGEGQTLWNDPAIYLFSFLGNLVVYDWLWGLNVYVWEKAHVNYLVLLDLSANHCPSSFQIFSKISVVTSVYLVILILYYKARRGQLYELHLEGHYFALFIALVALGYGTVTMILQRHHVSHRLYSPSVIFRIVTSPWSPVTLRESYMGDVMTSLIKTYSNCAYALCYLISGAFLKRGNELHEFGTCNARYMTIVTGVIAFLPLWFRFAQCIRRILDTRASTSTKSCVVWPHTYNAFKYFMSMVVVFFGLAHPLSETATSGTTTYHVIFIMVLIFTTSYLFYWDVYNDWGLFRILPDWKAVFAGDFSTLRRRGVFLRPTIMYKRNVHYYYIAMVLDLILRAVWTLSLIPQV
jgi:hypothetical protein